MQPSEPPPPTPPLFPLLRNSSSAGSRRLTNSLKRAGSRIMTPMAAVDNVVATHGGISMRPISNSSDWSSTSVSQTTSSKSQFTQAVSADTESDESDSDSDREMTAVNAMLNHSDNDADDPLDTPNEPLITGTTPPMTPHRMTHAQPVATMSEAAALQLVCSANSLNPTKQAFERTTSLTMFQIAHYRQLAGISHFTNLTSLTVMHQCLTTLRDDCFAHTPLLKTLRLTGNTLTSLGSSLRPLHQLEVLDVSENCLHSMQGVECVADTLTELVCYSNQLSDLSSMTPLTKLTQLNVANNPLSSIAGVERLTYLQSLNASATSVGELYEILHLKQLPELVDVAFNDPMWGESPICPLNHYQTYLLYHLPQVSTVDGWTIDTSDRQRSVGVYKRIQAAHRSRMQQCHNAYEDSQQYVISISKHYVAAATCNSTVDQREQALAELQALHQTTQHQLQSQHQQYTQQLQIEWQTAGNVRREGFLAEGGETSQQNNWLSQTLHTIQQQCPPHLHAVTVSKLTHRLLQQQFDDACDQHFPVDHYPLPTAQQRAEGFVTAYTADAEALDEVLYGRWKSGKKLMTLHATADDVVKHSVTHADFDSLVSVIMCTINTRNFTTVQTTLSDHNSASHAVNAKHQGCIVQPSTNAGAASNKKATAYHVFDSRLCLPVAVVQLHRCSETRQECPYKSSAAPLPQWQLPPPNKQFRLFQLPIRWLQYRLTRELNIDVSATQLSQAQVIELTSTVEWVQSSQPATLQPYELTVQRLHEYAWTYDNDSHIQMYHTSAQTMQQMIQQHPTRAWPSWVNEILLDHLSLQAESLTTLQLYQFPHLHKLSLEHCQLTSIPSAITSLHTLQSISLAHTALTEIDVSLFNACSLLETIDLSSNQIGVIKCSDSSMAAMTWVRSLYLDNNALSSLQSVSTYFPSLYELTAANNALLLQSNDLQSLSAFIAPLRELKQLVVLDLSSAANEQQAAGIHLSHHSNYRTSLLFQLSPTLLIVDGTNVTTAERSTSTNLYIGKLTIDELQRHCMYQPFGAVESLTLQNCDLRSIDVITSELLPALRTLDLSHNNITDVSSLQPLATLHHLKLNHNKISAVPLNNDIGHLSLCYPALTILELSSNKITSIEQLHLKFARLRVLALDENQIQAISSTAFRSTPTLQQLVLTHNQIRLLDIDCLAPLCHTLRGIQLEHNHIRSGALSAAMGGRIFTAMTSLYLAFNRIADLNDMEAMAGNMLAGRPALATNLQNLTLKNNPAARKPLYRSTVLHLFPVITDVDSVPVTDDERLKVELMYQPAPGDELTDSAMNGSMLTGHPTVNQQVWGSATNVTTGFAIQAVNPFASQTTYARTSSNMLQSGRQQMSNIQQPRANGVFTQQLLSGLTAAAAPLTSRQPVVYNARTINANGKPQRHLSSERPPLAADNYLSNRMPAASGFAPFIITSMQPLTSSQHAQPQPLLPVKSSPFNRKRL